MIESHIFHRCFYKSRTKTGNVEEFPHNATSEWMKHKWLCPISSPTFPGIPSNSPRCPWGFSMALVSTNCNAINSNAFSPWASCHRVTNLYWLSGFAIDLSGWAVFKRSRLGEIYWVITPETLVTIIITIAVTQAHEQDPSVIHLMAGR